MTILGIDPGKSGAVAVLDEGGELLKVARHAIDPRAERQERNQCTGQKPHRQIAHPHHRRRAEARSDGPAITEIRQCQEDIRA